MSHNHMFGSSDEHDSAGVPWEGRTFEVNKHAGDDGSADPAYLAAIGRLRAGNLQDEDLTDAHEQVVAAVAQARFLVPILAVAGDEGVNDRGLTVDKTQELALFLVEGPGGKKVQPVFSSVDTMKAWNPQARPVPTQARMIALATAEGEADWIVIDPVERTEFVLRRSAIDAIVQGKTWVAPYRDPEVVDAFRESTQGSKFVNHIHMGLGDPEAKGVNDELIVQVVVEPGTDPDALHAELTEIATKWQNSPIITHRTESIKIDIAVEGHSH